MWRADPDGAFRFEDATDPHQTTLFGSRQVDPAALLSRALARYAGQQDVLVEEIETWTLTQTPYLGKHMRAALKLGEQRGTFAVRPTKQNGSRRVSGSFPADVVIDFSAPTGPPPTQGSLFD